MKKLLLIVLPLLIIVGCSKPINEETLIDKDGLMYYHRIFPKPDAPYSGKVFKNHLEGKLQLEGSYFNGRKDGLWTYWDENGQKSSKGSYLYGRKDGLWTYWDETGQRRSKGSYLEGRKNGLWTYWYETGQMKKKIRYSHRDSTIINLWFKNGQMKREIIDGVMTRYYYNGQKYAEYEYSSRDRRFIPIKKWNEDGSVRAY